MILKAVLGVFLTVCGCFVFNGVWRVLYPEDVVPVALPEDVSWAVPKQREIQNGKIRPFTITTSHYILDHLKHRLNETRFPHAPLKGINFEYGFNLDYLKEIKSHWLNNYDWNARLDVLNSLPQFKTVISGLDIHFIHVKANLSVSKIQNVIPILLLHGWPGSVREFYDLIPQLSTPRNNYDFVFEVVAPSLPGFGYSEASAKPGLSTAQMGVIFKKLMHMLGHNKFYIHGGDAGSFIGTDMSVLYPDKILGFHSTLCLPEDDVSMVIIALGNFFPELIVEKQHKTRLYPLSNHIKTLWLETGYLHLQATKPDTIGSALLDSPIGLAAYILEKFSTWTNPDFQNLPDGGFTKKFTLDALLDNVMIYWTTDSILTSMRLYRERFGTEYMELGLSNCFSKVPTVCAQFPHEMGFFPEMVLKQKFRNLAKVSNFNDGGHFASFELPDVVANDIWASIPLFDEAWKNASMVSS